MFAYTVDEMPSIPRGVASHHLDIKLGFMPVKKKLRHQGAERVQAAREEVDKLFKVRFIRECRYSEWLANVVLVRKHQENGRCVWILLISTRLALKMNTLCLRLIDWYTQLLDMLS